jgi:hypothetical protein
MGNPRFISEEIEVTLGEQPALEKKPVCPSEFKWRGETFRIVGLLKEWQDYSRRGRMAHNMKAVHAEAAERHGSWGVGRLYYRVRTEGGRVFEVYYDRSPRSVTDRKGAWYLFREIGKEAGP